MKFPEWLPDSQRPQASSHKIRELLIESWLRPTVHFLHIESAGGFVLLACTLLALYLANSPWAEAYSEFWHTPIGFEVGGFSLKKSLLHWINDGLMTIFFFVIGLEIKRELVYGELRDPRKAALPAAAALGGMVAPALIYLLIIAGGPGHSGWGIPMATDIAFVVGFLALLGSRVPFGLKILLLTLAIVDDIGAILVIAIAYTSNTSVEYLAIGAGGFALVWLIQRIGVRSVALYVVCGAGIWYAFYKSGVHPTIAGVLLGLLTPARPWFSRGSLATVAGAVAERLQLHGDPEDTNDHRVAARLVSHTAVETVSPLDRLEGALHPWVAFGIMPLFALANAGVPIEPSALADPIALAVVAGLAIGKPVGIVLFSWAAVKVGLARLPSGVNWRVLFAAGCLAGIGFTMSLFIAGLALDDAHLGAGKIGTLVGSTVSAALGLTLLAVFLRRPAPVTEADVVAEKLVEESETPA